MKITRKQIAVIVVALLVIVAVVVTVVLLVGKKSKHSAPAPTPAPTPIPVPTGPIPSGTLSVGWYSYNSSETCINLTNQKNLDASSILLNLITNNPPSLNVFIENTTFSVKLLGFYNQKNFSETFMNCLFYVELPDDKNLITFLESQKGIDGNNIIVNPSRQYLVQSTYTNITHSNSTSIYTQTTNGLFVPISNVNSNTICTVNGYNPSSFFISLQPIQYYMNIMDRLNQTLG